MFKVNLYKDTEMNSSKNVFMMNMFFFSAALGIFFTGCSSEKELISNWRDKEVTIDGNASDWEGKLTYYTDYNAAVGIRNDDKNIYICLTTTDPMKVMPMFRRGFTIWLEPENDDSKTLGYKFPFFDNGKMAQPEPRGEGGGFNRENIEKMIGEMIKDQNEMQIFRKDKYPLTMISLQNNEGIKAALGYDNNEFVYELQVPLKGTNYQYAVSAAPGEKLKIKFETDQRQGGEGNGGRRMGGRGGMRPGGGEPGGGELGGGQPGGEMGNPGMRRASFEPFNFTLNVTLTTGSKQG